MSGKRADGSTWSHRLLTHHSRRKASPRYEVFVYHRPERVPLTKCHYLLCRRHHHPCALRNKSVILSCRSCHSILPSPRQSTLPRGRYLPLPPPPPLSNSSQPPNVRIHPSLIHFALVHPVIHVPTSSNPPVGLIRPCIYLLPLAVDLPSMRPSIHLIPNPFIHPYLDTHPNPYLVP